MSAKVRDLMTTPVITAEPTTSFKTAAELLTTHHIGALPVIDRDRRVVGLVSESDLLLKGGHPHAARRHPVLEGFRRRAVRIKAAGRTAGALMSVPAITVTDDATAAEAARLMHSSRVHHLPVVDADDRLVGMLSRSDLVRVFVRADESIHDAIVDGLLARHLWMDPARIRVEVNDGLVSLRGQVEARSLTDTVVRLVEELDGVVGVDHDLTWDFDDTRANRAVL